MNTILIDDLIALLNLMKEKNGAKRVNMDKLARDIGNSDCAKIPKVNDHLADLIASCPFFKFVDSGITLSNFPTPRIPVLGKTKIYEFENRISLLRAQRIMRDEGFRGATMGEGAVWAKRHPNFRGCILLPGQKARISGGFCIGVLDEQNSRRGLDLVYVAGAFPPFFRFLAMREQ